MLSKAEFVDFILNGGDQETAVTPQVPSDSTLPDGFEGFEGFDTVEIQAPPAQPGSSFARRLLEASGFGYPEMVQRENVIRSSDPVARCLPKRVSFWPMTTSRPYQTILFEADLNHKQVLDTPAFKSSKISHLEDVESALARMVSLALAGFQRGGEGVTADVRKGRKEETLCVVSILDERDAQAGRLVCFGTHNENTGGLETFQITEQTRLWDGQLAREHLDLLYERQFKKLETKDWQEAFTTTEERKQADRLLEVCTRATPKEHDIQESVLDLLDTIAKGFGLKKPGNRRRLQAFALPSDHDIGINPEDREKIFGGKNPFGGVTLRDERSRLLGYIVYPLKSKADAARLHRHLAENNRFHNVLVVYPDKDQASIELWQGREQLTGKLRKGQGYKDAADVVNLLSRFFVVSKAKVRNPTELAQELAYRARYLRRLAVEQLNDEADDGPLQKIFRAFTEALVHGQTEDSFADAYAQTLAYGLLAARWLSKDILPERQERFTRQAAVEFLPATSPFLREFFKTVLQAGFEAKLTWLLDDIAALLERTDVDLVFNRPLELKTALSTDPIIHFYEPFLAAYDADQRRNRGVYYTPDAIVMYMVATAAQLVAETSPGKKSLCSGNIRVVDPATGTGTFLREVLRSCIRNGTSALSIKKLVAQIRGFEIMVAPYAVCHLRMALLLRSVLMPEEAAETLLRVHLADTLELPIDPPPDLFEKSPALAQEAKAAQGIKEESGWTLVIGNPPYKNNSDVTLAQVAERFPALLATSRVAAAAQERNIRDDYAWFFAAAERLTRGGGCICFVTSDSYLKKASYIHFRGEMLRYYRIQRVTRLGPGLFENVGPRISFATILLQRRDNPLVTADATDVFELVDISALADGCPPRILGTPEDPRMLWLSEAASNESKVGRSKYIQSVKVERSNGYRFLPGAVDSSAGLAVQIVADKKSQYRSLFVKKWPGIITAFDCLLKGDCAETLAVRMRLFFRVAQKSSPSDMTDLVEQCGFNEAERERLNYLCQRVQQDGIKFSAKNIKPVFAGSIPRGNEWYPPTKYGHWVYYEPRIQIPRNVNPGKASGWGWMQQWRDPSTHEQFPKLIFTTSTNQKYGFRAYVISEGWYTKLHGAASQQYNYVTLNDPTKPAMLDGQYNNLTDEGVAALGAIHSAGLEDEDLFHIIATFYNSHYGVNYSEQESESMLPLPAIAEISVQTLTELAVAARRLRTLHGLSQPTTNEPFPFLPDQKRPKGDLGKAICDLQARVDDIVGGLVISE